MNNNSSKTRRVDKIIYHQLLKRHVFALTGSIRVLPDFLVIGAKRCGTTSLYKHLPEHPCVSKSPYDNMGFFNENFHLGVNWYKSFFPTTFTKNKIKSKFGNFLTFDVTTRYMEEESTAFNVNQTKSNMKIVVILRNPVDRAYSHYHVNVKEKSEKRSFEDAIFEEMNIIENEDINKILQTFPADKPHYLKKGLYALQLKPWFRIFPRENILILSTEEFEKNQDEVYRKIFNFLNVSDFKIKNKEKMEKGNYSTMNHNTRKKLLDFFMPHNNELFEMINEIYDWNS